MKFRGPVALALLAISLVAGTPAHAASTRTEYIAQVDPICQSFDARLDRAAKAYRRDLKRWVRDLDHGSLKNWERQTHRTFQSLRTWVGIDAGLTDQIAAVSPPAEDAATINAWLRGRNKSERWAYSAALAFDSFKFNLYRKRINQANRAYATGLKAISGFGFQICGVSV